MACMSAKWRTRVLMQAQYAWKDVFYTPERVVLQSMNIAIPKRPKGNVPTCVFVHGGSWQRGDKTAPFNNGIEETFAKAGYLGVSVNYRLSPRVTHPEHTRDVAKAIHWVHQNIHQVCQLAGLCTMVRLLTMGILHLFQYGGDPERIVVIGHSSGAHLVMNALADPQYLTEAGLDAATTRRIVRGVVGVSGVYNIVRLANAPLYGSMVVSPVFGDAVHAWREASITAVLTKQGSQSLLLHIPMLLLNAEDDFHLADDANELIAWLQHAGSVAPTHVSIAGRNHFTILGNLTEQGTKDEAMQHVVAFMENCTS
ncbi:TPA: hypothetical protein N0F65_009401 [Lagenidium giganteum]|uniref:BD-FAE-like domain-containing protein n=1 Tax=Lagenidium giganteum TaxID=4803 RepID=A0AAV2ZFV9_9STRA|nr:TPA: hypothetical protein N0F65_009401 [Lagenidium giganteum]